LLGRLALLAIVLVAECGLLAATPHAAPLLGPLAPFGIVSFAVFLGLAYNKLRIQRDVLPFGWRVFLAHVVCVGAVWLGNFAAQSGSGAWLNAQPALLVSGAVLVAGIVLLAQACIPFAVWLRTARETSPAWQYAVLAGIAAWLLRTPFQSLWIHSSAADVYWLQIIAFRSVQAILGVLLPNLVVDSGPFILGTPRFTVSIGAPCSGIEGLGLVLVFTIVWLWFFRKETRFPRAFLLIPCALVSVFLLNIVRIAVLILIGNAGAPEVAFVGFHSQAGWIAFTLVALGFSMATPAVGLSGAGAMLPGGSPEPQSQTADREEAQAGESPLTAAYLVPFLAILGASFISKSGSGYFERLYPLRFIAALVALWLFRRSYRSLDWRFGWAAPLTGAGVFAIWIAPTWLAASLPGWHANWFVHDEATSTLGTALAALSPAARWTWIGLRTAAAVITVPIAEELAFRGYLARRIMSREFDRVFFTRLSLVALGVSSLAFGVMHGQHWFVGILAGLAYAWLLRSKGRIGDAVVAHAVSNLLLAGWVLSHGAWSLW
jgi:exosortase E/protease (VPEID-CTERM system)